MGHDLSKTVVYINTGTRAGISLEGDVVSAVHRDSTLSFGRIPSRALRLTDQQHGRRRFIEVMDPFLHLVSLIWNSVYSLRALSIVSASPRDVLVYREVRWRGHPVDDAGIVLQRQFGIRGGLISAKS